MTLYRYQTIVRQILRILAENKLHRQHSVFETPVSIFDTKELTFQKVMRRFLLKISLEVLKCIQIFFQFSTFLLIKSTGDVGFEKDTKKSKNCIGHFKLVLSVNYIN